MNHDITVDCDIAKVDWQLVSDIYRSVNWGHRGGRENIINSFLNVKFKCFAYDNNVLVGFGKMMSDGVMYGAIYDVVVHKDYQKHGIGKLITNWLLESGSNLPWVTLFAAPGKEAFYNKLGFKMMKTAMMLPKNKTQDKLYCKGMA
jgi:N-acetylglutamate synthase-like GNAT family acetyltransferase